MRPRLALHRASSMRRVAATFVLLLQAAVVVSAVVEPPAQRPLVAHMEQPGARHVGLHNEATCLVCAVRAMQAAPAASDDLTTRASRAAGVEPAAGVQVEDSRAVLTNRSRAPPSLD